ncbi:hypothetical protein [Lysinibacillus antri]|uniref:hypothetical protein n=1 Tax=Lysinibacillus antri TaxID=2498145 RepID=UPI0015D2BECF|nr:hypothetical protein [Lysinibacillus antri]
MNQELLSHLVGQVIRVDRGGPHSAVGRLLYAGSDFFVIMTKKDGVVIYKTHHVKSITHDSKDGMDDDRGPDNLEAFNKPDFLSVISQFCKRWVKINPEKLEGVLDEVNDDYITIINKEEIIHVSVFHIRNMSTGMGVGNNDNEENNEDNNNNDGNGRRRRRR